ncbi:hypothetical protein Fmac_025630 [Flemingia macrophylla]|uniref:Uncharacterized protein n=1 Tax=Flemingia macrophylla TaxID=520843 RepID=A0ABD1LSS7_9FABA
MSSIVHCTERVQLIKYIFSNFSSSCMNVYVFLFCLQQDKQWQGEIIKVAIKGKGYTFPIYTLKHVSLVKYMDIFLLFNNGFIGLLFEYHLISILF